MREDQEADKKQAVMNATLALIAEKGFHGTSMSEVAKKAKVAVGTIYHYFPSKEELINELYLNLQDDLERQIHRGYEAGNPMMETLRRVWFNWIAFNVDHPEEFAFMEQYASSPFILSIVAECKNPQTTGLLPLLKDALETGFFKDLPPELLVALFYGPIVAISKALIAGGLPYDEAMLDAAFEAAFGSIVRTPI